MFVPPDRVTDLEVAKFTRTVQRDQIFVRQDGPITRAFIVISSMKHVEMGLGERRKEDLIIDVQLNCSIGLGVIVMVPPNRSPFRRRLYFDDHAVHGRCDVWGGLHYS